MQDDLQKGLSRFSSNRLCWFEHEKVLGGAWRFRAFRDDYLIFEVYAVSLKELFERAGRLFDENCEKFVCEVYPEGWC